MILQPSASEYSPWDIGNTQFGDSFIWIAAFLGLIFGILLLVDYFNRRRTSQILWSISCLSIYVYFHVLIAGGDYEKILRPTVGNLTGNVVAVLIYLIPALIAASLWFTSFKDRKFGNLFSTFAIVMLIATLILKLGTPWKYLGVSETPAIAELLALITLVPCYLSIIILPLLKIEDGKVSFDKYGPNLLISIGGLLAGAYGIVISVISWIEYAPDEFIEGTLSALPFVLIISMLFCLFGYMLHKDLGIVIPGVEFEETEARA